MFYATCSQSFLSLSGRMRFPVRSLKFCGARARFACVISAHAATRVTFHVFFRLPLPNNIVQTLSGAKGSSLSRLVEQCLNRYFGV